jgi:hypothetical protein
MGVTHSENFDSSTSLPSGWNTGDCGWSVRGAIYPSGIAPTGSANMLAGSTGSGVIFLTSGTAHGSSPTPGGSASCYTARVDEGTGAPGITQ